jgi:glycosyltransferase involved in cell wall biosynthesis
VFSIATELARLGWSPAIAVPGSPRGVDELGEPAFKVLSFRQARRGKSAFADGEGPDLVHAFTPRAPVRNLTLDLVRRWGCRYVVHLEDNELAVQAAVTTGYDAASVRAFLDHAAGVTTVIERLLEVKPDHLPSAVIWPGYDRRLDVDTRSPEAVRADVGLEKDELAIVYPGNVHEANVEEVRSLYQAVELMRAAGRDLVLVKSGWTDVSSSRLPRLGHGLRDVGWIARERVFELLRAADILIQPGAPGPFNDYRFPSKLPEFLASARPVVLPRTNVGLHLENGVEAMLLERGDSDEISEKVSLLADDPELRRTLGERGRAFALRELQWSANVPKVVRLYETLLAPE